MEYQSHRFDYDPETEIFTCFFCGMKCDINDAKSIIEAHYSSIRNCSEPAEETEPPEVE
jgi:hypothetical protein